MSADALSELLPEKDPVQWAAWLQNNRNQTRRVSYRIPFERLAGGIFYKREELSKYVEWEKMRKLGTITLTGQTAQVLQAFGIIDDSGSSRGRVFKGGSVTAQYDRLTGHYVRMIIDEPLMVFTITPEQAIKFGKELTEVGDYLKRKENPQGTDFSENYETVTDNANMKVMRLKERK
ncbi:hypothetical protein [Aquabacterium sp.]|uniref:hypothetical protein n=1 Tax=Aquabacterium sp. TaxID=1872578 RepID=UPI002489DB26|nr:hypothetical protein [Aquabacterium sp.]MDI1259366.1 hypothetical protein [Aquabacterium sp.]